jgi:hypothetical protein
LTPEVRQELNEALERLVYVQSLSAESGDLPTQFLADAAAHATFAALHRTRVTVDNFFTLVTLVADDLARSQQRAAREREGPRRRRPLPRQEGIR